jgi:peptidoglycan hydrolase CwlO-like protein
MPALPRLADAGSGRQVAEKRVAAEAAAAQRAALAAEVSALVQEAQSVHAARRAEVTALFTSKYAPHPHPHTHGAQRGSLGGQADCIVS